MHTDYTTNVARLKTLTPDTFVASWSVSRFTSVAELAFQSVACLTPDTFLASPYISFPALGCKIIMYIK